MSTKRRGGDRRLLSLRGVTLNARQKMDGIELFEALPDRIASLVVCDPQYRAVLDQLSFGNEGARQKGRAALPQMSGDTIAFFVEEAARILKPSAHLALWIDKFSLGSGEHLRWLRRASALKIVDLICWNKMDFGMGRRARCVSEYVVICQKAPQIAKGVWTDHRLPDCWPEGRNPMRHPHAKPHVLTERLIRAVTKKNDLVVDPCAGGFGVLDACIQTGRNFLGCDLNG